MPRRLQLEVPASLRCKAIVLGVTSAVARSTGEPLPAPGDLARLLDLSEPYAAELVSAVSELINNIAKHGYSHRPGTLQIEFTCDERFVQVEIRERGNSFDISQVVAPNLDALPEGGMGLYIARASVDELHYQPGDVNVWRLTKYRDPASDPGERAA